MFLKKAPKNTPVSFISFICYYDSMYRDQFRKNFIFAGLLALLLAAPLSAGERLSDYTLRKYQDFTGNRIRWTCITDNNVILKEIDAFIADVYRNLPFKALDYEQEKLFWESNYQVETFCYVFAVEGLDLKQVRLALKELMQKDEAYISSHEKMKGTNGGVAPQMYILTSDVTSCYMSFSVASAMFHGMRVKGLYAAALRKAPTLWNANTGMGQWLYYAPGIFGGGLKKAAKYFQAAYDGATDDCDRFFTSVYLSQIRFEEGNTAECARYLAEAEAICPESHHVKNVRRQNAKGKSLFYYNRHRSGVDDNSDPDATELN